MQPLNTRQQAILERLRAQQYLLIEELAEQLLVTPQTIRRDINDLCDKGLARRHHGGVGLPAGLHNTTLLEREHSEAEAKLALADVVARHVPNSSSLFLGVGSTMVFVAQALRQHRDLRIITNNLAVARVLCDSSDIEVLVAGGSLRHNDQDVVGSATIGWLNQFRADVALIGCGGIDLDFGVMDFTPEEAEISRVMAANASETLLAFDHSKWTRRALVKVCPLAQIDLIATNRLTLAQQERLAEARIHTLTPD